MTIGPWTRSYLSGVHDWTVIEVIGGLDPCTDPWTILVHERARIDIYSIGLIRKLPTYCGGLLSTGNLIYVRMMDRGLRMHRRLLVHFHRLYLQATFNTRKPCCSREAARCRCKFRWIGPTLNVIRTPRATFFRSLLPFRLKFCGVPFSFE